MLKKPPIARATAVATAVGATIAMTGLPALAVTYDYTEIPQADMTAVAADSVETTGEGTNGPLELILDGKTDTYWHTKWQNGIDPLPHWFIVKLGDAPVDLGRIDLVPRQSSNGSGRVGEYEIFALNTSGSCDAAAFEKAEPITSGSFDAEDNSSTRQITFTPAKADCVKVQYNSTWGGDGSAEKVASLAEFQAFTATEQEPPDPSEAPKIVVPEGALEITDGTVTVRTHPAFPQVVDYRMGDAQMAGKFGDPLTQMVIDGTNQTVTVGEAKVSADGTSVTYPITFPGLEGASMNAVISVKDQALTYTLTDIVDPNKAINRIDIPGLDLVSLTEQDSAAQILPARMSVSRESSGDKLINLAGANDQNGVVWMIAAAQSNLAAGFETNAIGDGTVKNGGNTEGRFAYGVKHIGGVAVGTVSAAQWTYRGGGVLQYDDGSGIGVDDDPYIKIKLTADANSDGAVDWQDSAIATRDILTPISGAEDVSNYVVSRIPFNIVSQATHPFLRTLDDTKRISLATDNLGQHVLLKGYQAEGHDSAQGDYAGHYNEKAGGLKDLKTLVSEGKNWNATFGIHVNATESYSEAKVFGPDLLRMPPQKAWGWMNQAYYMNGPRDLATGNVLDRLAELRADFPADSNLNWLYWDVYWPRGWEGDRFAQEVTDMGFRVGSEWSNALARQNTWAHWANEENYGGQTNKGINSQLVRFVENTYRDTFNPHPMLGNTNVVEFEGWTTHNNYNPFIRNVWERNLPTKFLQQSEIMKWEPNQITFKNGTVVTSPLDSIGGSVVPTNRTITYDGATVYDQGAYLFPWSDGGADRLYYWNPSGEAQTWKLTDSWAGQGTLKLFKLTDTGREHVADIAVADGSVSLPATEEATAYVLYPSSAVPEAKTPNWGQASNINDPGFFSGTLDAYTVKGDVKVVQTGRGNFQAQMGSGASSIAQKITVPQGSYSAWAWVEIEKGKTRNVTVSASGDGITPQVNQATKDGAAVTTIKSSSAMNATASDEKNRTFFQRVPVRFTSDGSPFTLTIAAADGDAVVSVDDLRIVEQAAPSDPKRTDETIVFQDFEDVDDGYWPFVTGRVNAGGDARTQLAELHAPYSQSGWYAVTGNQNVAQEGQKFLDNVLDGDWSLMAHQENRGMILRTTTASVPFEAGHTYRVSFDYQAGFADDYQIVLGTDTGSWTEQIQETWPLPQARGKGWKDADGNAGIGTQVFTKEIKITSDDPVFLGVVKTGNQTQGDLIIDNFRVEDLKAEPYVNITGEPQKSDDDATYKMLVTTTVNVPEGSATDVKHNVTVPDGWTLKPVKAGEATASASKPSVATWELLIPKNAEPADVTLEGTFKIDGKAGSDTMKLPVDPAKFPLVNPIGGKDLAVVDVSSEETSGEPAPNGFATAAIDGDVNTYWHTEWSSGSPNYPHSIVLQPKVATENGVTCKMSGFEYTARQGADNGRAEGYEIYVSKDGKTWGDPVATGEFADVLTPQVVHFDAVEGSFVKLVETSSINGKAFGGAAELRLDGTCTEPVVPVDPFEGVFRVGGSDRYQTAAKISQLYEPGVDTLYVATGQDYPDALTAAAIAGNQEAPVLLVQSNKLDPEVSAAIKKLEPNRIVIVGGTGAVSTKVESDLKAGKLAKEVKRIGGSDRFDTAAKLAADAYPKGADVVYLASGLDFPDALSASAAAAYQGGPVLLVTKNDLRVDTEAALKVLKPKRIVAVGGSGVVHGSVIQKAASLNASASQRLFGHDRFATAQDVAQTVFGKAGVPLAVVANGMEFPDALVGAALAGAHDGPVLLTETDRLNPPTARALKYVKPEGVMVSGGSGAVSDSVKAEIGKVTGLTVR